MEISQTLIIGSWINAKAQGFSGGKGARFQGFRV